MGKGEGRGGGKGGCGMCDAIGDAIQCIGCCLCFCCVTGPVLIIVGIIFISSAFTDGRGEKIDEFNAAVSSWADGTVDSFSTTAGWQYQLSNDCSPPALPRTGLDQSETSEALGSESAETDVFASYGPVKYTDIDPTSAGLVDASDTNCDIEVSIFLQDTIVGNLTTKAVERKVLSFSSMCTKTQREDRNGRRYYDERSDVSSCNAKCAGRGGTSSGSSYSSFECVIQEAPTEICVRVSKNSGGWFIAQGVLPDRPAGATGIGCFRQVAGGWEAAKREPFSGSTTLRVAMQVRHERDPYLYFLDISNGTSNFGLTTGEKLKIGFTLLFIGIFITTLVCGACYCVVSFAWSFANGGNKERPQNAVGGALYDVSAKYGSYIPGGATAVGVPAHMPIGDVQKPPPGINAPPAGYTIGAQPGSPPGVAGYPYDHSPYGSPTAVQPQPNMPPGYGGSGPPPGYGGPGFGAPPPPPPPDYGAPGYGGGQPGGPAYGAPAPSYAQPGYGAVPAGYPTY